MMLQVDVDLRFSALQVLEHPWVNVSIFRLVDASFSLAPLSSSVKPLLCSLGSQHILKMSQI